MHKISIIISAHKDSPYLPEAIEGALCQNFDDYEVILSSDGCEELYRYAEEYEDIRICLSPKKNHSHALNNAVLRANGEWIKECHYDDILLPNCLKDMWECRGGSLVYANAINFWPDGHERFYLAPDKIEWNMLWPPIKNPVHAAALMWRRDNFLEVGGRDEDMIDAEEYEYYLKLIHNGYELKHCDKTVVRYRIHGDSKSATYSQPGVKRLAVFNHLIHKYGTRNSGFAGME